MKKILIVDDDELTLELYDLLLEGMEEISYKTAESGTSAIEYLAECQEEMWPDYIFIDLHMPDMSGFEFAEKFGEIFNADEKDCQLFILTSSVSHRDQERVQKTPILKGILSKPLTEEALEKFIGPEKFPVEK